MQPNPEDHELLRSVESQNEVKSPSDDADESPAITEPTDPASPSQIQPQVRSNIFKPVPLPLRQEDDYARRMAFSTIASIAANIVLIILFAWFGSTKWLHPRSHSDKKKTPIQMVLIKKKPDLKRLASQAKENPKTFLETDASQASATRPIDAKHYSEHNSIATQAIPSGSKTGEIPTADGKNVKSMRTETVTEIRKGPPPPPTQPPNEQQKPDPVLSQNQPRIQKPQPVAVKTTDLALLKIPPKPDRPLTEEEVVNEAQRKIIESAAPRAPPEPPGSIREIRAVKSKLEGGGIPQFGKALQFNSTQSEFASYDKKVIAKLDEYFKSRVQDRFFPKDNERVEVEVAFRILASGELTNIRITRNKSNPVLGGWCVQVVKQCSPVDPFPEQWRGMSYREASTVFQY